MNRSRIEWPLMYGRRIVAFVLIGVSVLGLFSGCGSGDTPQSDADRVIARAEGYIVSIDFSPDWQTLALGTSHEGAQVWSVPDDKLLYKLEPGNVRSVDVSPDGNLLALSWRSKDDKQGAVEIRQASDGKLVHSLPDNGLVYSVAFSPDGGLLAAGGSQEVWLYDVASGESSVVIEDVPGWRVRFSPDGTALMVSTDRITLYSTTDGMPLREVDGWGDGAWSPDGKLFATHVQQSGIAVQIYNSQTWEAVSRLEQSTDAKPVPQVQNMVFSPDGKLFVAGTNSGRAELWEVESGEHIRTFEFAQTLDGSKVAFSPDSKRLAIQNAYDVRVWELEK